MRHSNPPARSFHSEAAQVLQARIIKYQDKLFTFIRYDSVPSNNNNAENAIKQFAYYREDTAGVIKESGLNDYLVLLSIYQPCRYKGISFLKFLLSKERDIDAFCAKKRVPLRRPAAPAADGLVTLAVVVLPAEGLGVVALGPRSRGVRGDP